MRVQSLGAWAALLAICAVASCGADHRDETIADRAEPAVITTEITPSSEARARIEALRERFRVTPAVTPAQQDPKPSAVVGPGVATAFEATGTERVHAVIPLEAKRGIARTASVELPMRATGMARLEDDTSHVSVGFALRDAADVPVAVADGMALYAGALAGADVVHRLILQTGRLRERPRRCHPSRRRVFQATITCSLSSLCSSPDAIRSTRASYGEGPARRRRRRLRAQLASLARRRGASSGWARRSLQVVATSQAKEALYGRMKMCKPWTALLLAGSVSLGCGGAPERVPTGPVEANPCPTTGVLRDRPVAPVPRVASIGGDAESRVRTVAEVDLHCSAQQVYVRRVYDVGDVDEGGTFEFYAAERCGSYQVYRVPTKERAAVAPDGVDIFLVSPVSPPRITSIQPFYARPPSSGEALLLVDRKGVVCRASVGKKVADEVWTIDNCSSERVAVVGVVAIRATEATNAARLETHWIGELPRPKTKEPVAPWSDGGDSMWKPFTVVDLSGDRTRQVAVYCRRPATGEYECERFMVTRGSKEQAGWFVPVARARWTPSASE